MKTAVRPSLKSNTFCISKSCSSLREQESSFTNLRVYQKLFVVLISLSTILILPESPRDLENICEIYNSRKICNVW